MLYQHHPVFDLAEAIRRYPIGARRREVRTYVENRAREHPGAYADRDAVERHIRLMEPDGTQIIAPRDIAEVEQLRAESKVLADLGPTCPTDVMIWAVGEPRVPWGMKIGGVPYRPADALWPSRKVGRFFRRLVPLSFIGQICFADSIDILPKPIARSLGGDVLLIFGACHDGGSSQYVDCYACSYERGAFYTEWQSIGLGGATPLSAAPQGAPPPRPVAHAWLHRTVDYANVPPAHPLHDAGRSSLLDRLEGGKIGGLPRFVQNDPERNDFVAAIGPVRTTTATPLIGDAAGRDSDFLMMDDMGSLYLFVDPSGTVHWDIQGY